jgi:hypothetical protein
VRARQVDRERLLDVRRGDVVVDDLAGVWGVQQEDVQHGEVEVGQVEAGELLVDQPAGGAVVDEVAANSGGRSLIA